LKNWLNLELSLLLMMKNEPMSLINILNILMMKINKIKKWLKEKYDVEDLT
jgi:hypothetical protein